jgi:hypothetical protein
MSDFEIKRGDTWIHEFYFLQDDGITPMPITGATSRMQLRDDADSILIDASTANGLLTLRLEDGVVVATIPYDEMESVPVGEHRFDCEIVYASNTKESSPTYTLGVVEDITR